MKIMKHFYLIYKFTFKINFNYIAELVFINCYKFSDVLIENKVKVFKNNLLFLASPSIFDKVMSGKTLFLKLKV